jgi:uncharacterized repeat protein (TIGR01451 family)
MFGLTPTRRFMNFGRLCACGWAVLALLIPASAVEAANPAPGTCTDTGLPLESGFGTIELCFDNPGPECTASDLAGDCPAGACDFDHCLIEVCADCDTVPGTCIPAPLPCTLPAILRCALWAGHCIPPCDTQSTETIDCPPDPALFTIDSSKSDTLAVDQDMDGFAEAGDEVDYTIDVTNTEAFGLSNVDYFDSAAPGSSLIVGSVSASSGTVVKGNTLGDTEVVVDFGTLAGGALETVSFSVAIDNPETTNALFAQGCTGVDFDAFCNGQVTDDPDTIFPLDPTSTGVGESGIYIRNFQKLSDTQGELSGPGNPGALLADGDYLEIVEPIGDLDGDGIDDIALSTWSSTASDLYLAELRADGSVKQRYDVPSPVGSTIGDAYGRCTAFLGDLDGPGGADFALAVGAQYDNGGGSARGAVHILFLNNDGTLASTTKIADGGSGGFPGGTLSDNDFFGACVENLGDLDGAGGAAGAIAVGASADDEGGSAAGAVWILFLDSSGTVFGSPVQITQGYGGFDGTIKESGASGPDFFGTSIESLGDLDGDGNPEIAVGEERDDVGGVDAGAVWIFSLDTTGNAMAGAVKHDAGDARLLPYSAAGNRFGGNRLGRISDLDGDDVPELLVRSGNGYALLLLDTDKTIKSVQSWDDALEKVPELQGAAHFAAQEIGDLDGDTRPEIAFSPGDALDDDGGTDRGAVYVLYPAAIPVPEPGGLLGLVSGIALLAGVERRRNRNRNRPGRP